MMEPIWLRSDVVIAIQEEQFAQWLRDKTAAKVKELQKANH